MSGSESGLISYVSDMAEVGEDVVAAPVAAPVDIPLLSDIWLCKRVETFHKLRKNKWCKMMR